MALPRRLQSVRYTGRTLLLANTDRKLLQYWHLFENNRRAVWRCHLNWADNIKNVELYKTIFPINRMYYRSHTAYELLPHKHRKQYRTVAFWKHKAASRQPGMHLNVVHWNQMLLLIEPRFLAFILFQFQVNEPQEKQSYALQHYVGRSSSKVINLLFI